MSFYDFDTNIVGPQLMPPELRKSKHLAWIRVILSPVQYLRDLFFNLFIGGQVYPIYGAFTPYNRGDRVTNYDKAVYECLINGTVSGLSGPSGDPAWMKVVELFIGVDERVLYSSQIIVLEYALNKYFLVQPADPQIYISNNTTSTIVFVMGNSGTYSSNLANDSNFSTSWMSNSPSFSAPLPPFTVYVPSALFATLGLNVQDQENTVRQFVDRYRLGGITYNVTTF